MKNHNQTIPLKISYINSNEDGLYIPNFNESIKKNYSSDEKEKSKEKKSKNNINDKLDSFSNFTNKISDEAVLNSIPGKELKLNNNASFTSFSNKNFEEKNSIEHGQRFSNNRRRDYLESKDLNSISFDSNNYDDNKCFFTEIPLETSISNTELDNKIRFICEREINSDPNIKKSIELCETPNYKRNKEDVNKFLTNYTNNEFNKHKKFINITNAYLDNSNNEIKKSNRNSLSKDYTILKGLEDSSIKSSNKN